MLEYSYHTGVIQVTNTQRAQHHLYYVTKLCSEHYANEGACSWYRHEYACAGNNVSSNEWEL